MFILIINAGQGQLIFVRYQNFFFAYNVNLAFQSEIENPYPFKMIVLRLLKTVDRDQWCSSIR